MHAKMRGTPAHSRQCNGRRSAWHQPQCHAAWAAPCMPSHATSMRVIRRRKPATTVAVLNVDDLPKQSTQRPRPASPVPPSPQHTAGTPAYVPPPLSSWRQDPVLMSGCEVHASPLNVAVLLSGGVDSSLALQLLVAAGHRCTAFYLQIWFQEDFRNFWDSCPWEEDLEYARKVCDSLGVPLEVVPMTSAYWDRVVAASVGEIRAGRTPNPDVLCNSRVKFGAFVDHLATRGLGTGGAQGGGEDGVEGERGTGSGGHGEIGGSVGSRASAGSGSGSTSGSGGGGANANQSGSGTGPTSGSAGVVFDRVASGHYARVVRRDGSGAAAGAAPVVLPAPTGSDRSGGSGGDGTGGSGAVAKAASVVLPPPTDSGRRDGGGSVAYLALTPDAVKDQTYFLAHLNEEQLGRAMFPLGGLTKPQVRSLAAAAGLATQSRKDSQGICFLGKVKFPEFVKEHLGEWQGLIVEEEEEGEAVAVAEGGRRGGKNGTGGAEEEGEAVGGGEQGRQMQEQQQLETVSASAGGAGGRKGGVEAGAAQVAATGHRLEQQGPVKAPKAVKGGAPAAAAGDKGGVAPTLARFGGRRVLGLHAGYWFYTVGQRGGIKLPGGPWYVVRKDCDLNVVYVSRRYYAPSNRRNAFVTGSFSWLSDARPDPASPLLCKVRHGPHAYQCELRPLPTSLSSSQQDSMAQGLPRTQQQDQVSAYNTRQQDHGMSHGQQQDQGGSHALQHDQHAAHGQQQARVPAHTEQQPQGGSHGQRQDQGSSMWGGSHGHEWDHGALVVLDGSDQGLASGQYAVLYQGGVCLGSAQIEGCVDVQQGYEGPGQVMGSAGVLSCDGLVAEL